MSIKSSKIKKIGSFIFDDTYWIPDYQREYSWDKEELTDLWIDLEEMINGEMESHFFGQIVVHNSINEKKEFYYWWTATYDNNYYFTISF